MQHFHTECKYLNMRVYEDTCQQTQLRWSIDDSIWPVCKLAAKHVNSSSLTNSLPSINLEVVHFFMFVYVPNNFILLKTSAFW